MRLLGRKCSTNKSSFEISEPEDSYDSDKDPAYCQPETLCIGKFMMIGINVLFKTLYILLCA